MNIEEQSLSEVLRSVERVIHNVVKHSEEGSIIQSEAELAFKLIIRAKELTGLGLATV